MKILIINEKWVDRYEILEKKELLVKNSVFQKM